MKGEIHVSAFESVRDLEDERRTVKKSWVGAMLGLWLSGVFAASLFGRADAATYRSIGMAVLGAAIVWPLGYFLFSRSRFIPRALSPVSSIALAAFGLFCILSSFVSPLGFDSAGYAVLTMLACWVVLQFNTSLDVVQLERGLKIYSFLMTGLIVGFALYDYVPGTRLGSGKSILNPNTVALVAMSPFLTAMAIRLKPARFVLMALLGTVIALTGSRAAAVAAIIGLIVCSMLRLRTLSARNLLALALCFVMGGIAVIVWGDPLLQAVDKFFAIHDRHRGVESGASGRFETWVVVWNLFLSHPFLGVGFRAHEMLLKINTSAHNGYLALLVEIGLFGFVAVLWLAFSGVRVRWQLAKDGVHGYTSSVLLGLSCGFLALAMFERYFINVGNPTSLLFLLSILVPAAVPLGDMRQSEGQVQDPVQPTPASPRRFDLVYLR